MSTDRLLGEQGGCEMKLVSAALLGAVFVILSFVFAQPASAQATRTWVSGVGDDVNPCSRTAPCKTFAGAISKTAAGGEINCLDPGGFGALTITKSITIDCTGTMGSTLNSGGINGFVINDALTATPNTVDVIIRGISIDGAGTIPGLNGIRFLSGRSLVLKDVLIQNQNGGNGIAIQPVGAVEVYADNLVVTDSGNGIHVQPGAAGSARIVLSNVRIDNNSGRGLNVDTTGATGAGSISITADRASFSGNGGNGVHILTPAGTIQAAVMLTNSIVANNAGTGLFANGGTALMRVAFTTITGNAVGVNGNAGNGSQIASYGNNRNIGNPTVGAANNGSFTGAVIPTQ